MRNRRSADSPGIAERVRSVAQMGRQELESEWQSQFGVPPPSKLRMELMRPVLIYRIQDNAYGLELDPLYADTIIRRWQRQTKLEAVHVETGETFNRRDNERAQLP